MKLVSYAQNFEDVMLWRALGHIEQGFFIDVGANDPDNESVTRAFYDRGWSGINIEPLRPFHARLQERRPRDVNLLVGLGKAPARSTFHVVGDSGLSTNDAAIAERHSAEGWPIERIEIAIETLAQVCSEHVTGDIHFLKLDVEGSEKDVLLGADFTRWRPWILVIEATEPNSQTPNHEEWEPLLKQANYDFVYFDGLNRFYVAHEHAELKEAFVAPPNVFDEFVSSSVEQARTEASLAHAQAEQAQAEVKLAHTQAEQAHTEAEQAHTEAEQAHAEAQQAHVETERAHVQAQQAHAEAEQANRAARIKAVEIAALQAEIEALQLIVRQASDGQARQAQPQAPIDENIIQVSALEIQQLEEELEVAREARRIEIARYDQVSTELAAVYASTSWKLTRPLRVAMRTAKNPKYALIILRRQLAVFKPLVRRVLAKAVKTIHSQPRLHSFFVRTLRRFPSLENRVRSLASRTMSTMDAPVAPLSTSPLHRGAQRWHAALKRVTNQSDQS